MYPQRWQPTVACVAADFISLVAVFECKRAHARIPVTAFGTHWCVGGCNSLLLIGFDLACMHVQVRSSTLRTAEAAVAGMLRNLCSGPFLPHRARYSQPSQPYMVMTYLVVVVLVTGQHVCSAGCCTCVDVSLGVTNHQSCGAMGGQGVEQSGSWSR